ncbi:MAG: FtsX-like permease family protein [Bryobacteraceae bacterium]
MNRDVVRKVRERAQDRCEYCHLPANVYRLPFHVDHIIARQHGGETVLQNLALACLHCKSVVKQVSPAITLDFQAFDETIREGLLRERLMATLSSFFGALAALIAAIGLYGVMAYLVVKRTNEIGIRMALGADRRNLVGLVMREAASLLLIGLAVGAALAMAAGSAAGSLLFGLKSTNAGILAMAAALLAAVTLAASYLPAWRAARLDSMAALREE